MKENEWDKLLQIKTAGRDETNADAYHHPYEPTPYCVLERLIESGLIGKTDVVLDYGCGKGRVGFFLSYRLKARVIGIEYDDRIYGKRPTGADHDFSVTGVGGSKCLKRFKSLLHWKRRLNRTVLRSYPLMHITDANCNAPTAFK